MIVGVVKHASMITSFVLIMMLLIEYINVQTHGVWQRGLRASHSGQILLGAFLGAVPGCLGAFTVVSLYSHRALSFGALVAAMIATSGDESFVLFSMVPAQALRLTAILFLVALVAGWLTDRLFKRQSPIISSSSTSGGTCSNATWCGSSCGPSVSSWSCTTWRPTSISRHGSARTCFWCSSWPS